MLARLSNLKQLNERRVSSLRSLGIGRRLDEHAANLPGTVEVTIYVLAGSVPERSLERALNDSKRFNSLVIVLAGTTEVVVIMTDVVESGAVLVTVVPG